MEFNGQRGMVKCWYCGSIGFPMIAADNTIRCKVCAKPIGNASDMLESAVPIDTEKKGSEWGLIVFIIIISLLLIPTNYWFFVIPLLVCLFYITTECEKQGEAELGTIEIS